MQPTLQHYSPLIIAEAALGNHEGEKLKVAGARLHASRCGCEEPLVFGVPSQPIDTSPALYFLPLCSGFVLAWGDPGPGRLSPWHADAVRNSAGGRLVG